MRWGVQAGQQEPSAEAGFSLASLVEHVSKLLLSLMEADESFQCLGAVTVCSEPLSQRARDRLMRESFKMMFDLQE